MSVLDKIVAAVSPPESEEDRAEARGRAQRIATGCEWLALVLDHHSQLEAAFARAKSAGGADARRAALKSLAALMTGHSVAEETAVYPHLALHDQKAHATAAYTEQSAATMQMGMLETIDPDSPDWFDKLKHIEGAVQHHMYQEEGTWFPELARTAPADHSAMIARRYAEEFDRYMGYARDAETGM